MGPTFEKHGDPSRDVVKDNELGPNQVSAIQIHRRKTESVLLKLSVCPLTNVDSVD